MKKLFPMMVREHLKLGKNFDRNYQLLALQELASQDDQLRNLLRTVSQVYLYVPEAFSKKIEVFRSGFLGGKLQNQSPLYFG